LFFAGSDLAGAALARCNSPCSLYIIARNVSGLAATGKTNGGTPHRMATTRKRNRNQNRKASDTSDSPAEDALGLNRLPELATNLRFSLLRPFGFIVAAVHG
jgi:hypothetical protein